MSALPPESAAVEEVRAYLATLRGGAPFLSGRDGHLLVTWLEAGVSVGAILRSLDRASDARRARQIRAPLSLSHARVYLKREMKVSATSVPGTLHDLVPAPAQDDPLGELLTQARAAIAALTEPEPEARARAACAIARTFFDDAWERAEGPRAALLASAKEELGELEGTLPDHEFITVCEDLARFRLRERYPSMSATRIWEQCGLGA